MERPTAASVHVSAAARAWELIGWIALTTVGGGTLLAATLVAHVAVLARHQLEESDSLVSTLLGLWGASAVTALALALPLAVTVAAAEVVLRRRTAAATFIGALVAMVVGTPALAWGQFRFFQGRWDAAAIAVAVAVFLTSAAAGLAAGRRLAARAPAAPAHRLLWSGAALSLVALTQIPSATPSWPGERRSPASPRGDATELPPGDVASTVVLVTVDTLRADHTTPYGYALDTTPNLQRFAEQGALVSRMTAATTCTVPSVATLLSGLPPWCTGITTQAPRRPLAEDADTLAERFKRAGYETIAVVANDVIRPSLGFAQGFDAFVNPAKGDDYPRAEEVTRLALARIDAAPARVFLWVHYMDPHYPYEPPQEDLDELVASGQYASRRLPAIQYGSRGGARTDRILGDGAVRSVDEGRMRARYDAEIRRFDTAFGKLVAGLERRSRLVDAVVALTADHGEALGDHGLYFQHCQVAYESVSHVPAVFWAPGVVPQGTRVDRPAAHADVPVTLLELAGLPAHADLALPGSNLLDGASPASRPVFGQSAWWDGVSLELIGRSRLLPVRSVVEEGWKYVLQPSHELSSVRGPRGLVHAWRATISGLWTPSALFHLASDPGELHDRSADQPERARRLRRKLERYPAESDWEACRHDPGALLTDEERQRQLERLRAVGYVG